MTRKIISIILCIVLAVPFFASAAEAESSFVSGAYLVTADKGVTIYSTHETSFDYLATAPEGAYLNIIEITEGFGYTVYNSVYGWVDLGSGMEFVSRTPAVIDGNRIEGVKGIKVTKLPEKLNYIEGEDIAELDGIEVYHPNNTPVQEEMLKKYAKAKGLLAIGGTDFKGMYSKNTVCIGDCMTPDADLKALMSYKAKMKKKKAATEK